MIWIAILTAVSLVICIDIIADQVVREYFEDFDKWGPG